MQGKCPSCCVIATDPIFFFCFIIGGSYLSVQGLTLGPALRAYTCGGARGSLCCIGMKPQVSGELRQDPSPCADFPQLLISGVDPVAQCSTAQSLMRFGKKVWRTPFSRVDLQRRRRLQRKQETASASPWCGVSLHQVPKVGEHLTTGRQWATGGDQGPE